MKSMTYEDWKLAGFQVKRGAKSVRRDKLDRALFSRDQVRPILDDDVDCCAQCGYWGAACKCLEENHDL